MNREAGLPRPPVIGSQELPPGSGARPRRGVGRRSSPGCPVLPAVHTSPTFGGLESAFREGPAQETDVGSAEETHSPRPWKPTQAFIHKSRAQPGATRGARRTLAGGS